MLRIALQQMHHTPNHYDDHCQQFGSSEYVLGACCQVDAVAIDVCYGHCKSKQTLLFEKQ